MKYKDKVTGCIEECDAIATVNYVNKIGKDGKRDKHITLILDDWSSIKQLNDEIVDFFQTEPLIKFEPWRKALVAWCDTRAPIKVYKKTIPDTEYQDHEPKRKLVFVFDEGEQWQQEISFVLASSEIDSEPIDYFGNNGEQGATWEALEDGGVYDMEELLGIEYETEYDKAHDEEFRSAHFIHEEDDENE